MRRFVFALAALVLAAVLPAHADNRGIQVLSATIKDQKIAGASVILQADGRRSTAVITDANGRATPSGSLDAAETLLILKKTGYSDLVVKCPCNGLTYAMSPVMHSLDGLRVVLNWGEQPEDLDSHFSYPDNHVFFSHKQGLDANLDVDDINSYGPETITLERKRRNETYVYAVHDYTDLASPESTALSHSDAKVFVYVGESLVRTYYVPRDRIGNLWTVFRIDGNGEFQDVNEMTGVSVQPDEIDTATNRYSTAAVETVAVSARDVQRAKDLNKMGEDAYHAGDVDRAIDLYRQAIEADADYGQAYSNLGLAYVKSNRSAEAIWASRNAIALASGAGAATLRAASYFNIAKLYEKAGQSEDALHNYESAQGETANPAYERAIQRLRKK